MEVDFPLFLLLLLPPPVVHSLDYPGANAVREEAAHYRSVGSPSVRPSIQSACRNTEMQFPSKKKEPIAIASR